MPGSREPAFLPPRCLGSDQNVAGLEHPEPSCLTPGEMLVNSLSCRSVPSRRIRTELQAIGETMRCFHGPRFRLAVESFPVHTERRELGPARSHGSFSERSVSE